MAGKWMASIMASLIFIVIGAGIATGVIRLPLQDFVENGFQREVAATTEAQAQYRRGERRRSERRRGGGVGFGITIDLGKIFSGSQKKKRKAKKRRTRKPVKRKARRKPEKRKARRKPEKKRKEWKVIEGTPELPITKLTAVAGWKKEYEGVCDTWGKAVIVKESPEGKYCIWSDNQPCGENKSMKADECVCNPGFDQNTYPDCKPIGWKDPVREAQKPKKPKLKPVPSIGLPGILPAPGYPIEESEREEVVIGAKPKHYDLYPEPPTCPKKMTRSDYCLTAEGQYKDSGHGLLGGMAWVDIAFDVPPGLSPDKEREMRAEQNKRLQDARENVALREDKLEDPSEKEKLKEPLVDTAEYNFVFGLAVSTDTLEDLLLRALRDNLSKGRATPKIQKTYNLLRGRCFESLDCHSNGAMICLHALFNKDVKARNVRLFGPQITPDTLSDWKHLLRSKQIETLEIFIADRDPVPWVAHEARHFIPGKGTYDRAKGIVSKFLLGEVKGLKRTRVECDFGKPFPWDISCHDMRHYQKALKEKECGRPPSSEVRAPTPAPKIEQSEQRLAPYVGPPGLPH